MTTKSVFMLAAATAGMVATAEVWDVKFTLKTVENGQRTSVTIKGAWDDSVAGQYSFWNDKTKVPLKDVEFATTKPANYGRSNQALNAQLLWGALDKPDGVLVAAGFGTYKRESGQVAGTYGGMPASGTWSIKRSTKTFDKLNKANGAVDTAANQAAKKAAQDFLANAMSATDVIKKAEEASAKCDEDAAKLAEVAEKLTAAEGQVADLQTKAEEAAAAQQQAEAAQAKAEAAQKQAEEAVAAAEQKADATQAELEAAQKQVAETKAAAEAAQKQADEAAALAEQKQADLEAAEKQVAELEASNNVMSNALATLNDAASNTGVVIQVQDTYQAEIKQYGDTAVAKFLQEQALDTTLVPNVTNAVLAISNELATAKATLATAQDTLADMQAFDIKDYASISYSNNLETVLYPQYEVITNETWRNAQLDDAADDMVKGTNDTYVAWTNAYTTLTNAEAYAAQLQKDADQAWRDFKKSGGWGGSWTLDLYIDATNQVAATNAVIAEVYGPSNDLKKAAYDDANQKIADFLAGKDIDALKAEIKSENDKLAAVMKEWGAYTVDNFHNVVIPGQEKIVDEQTTKRADLIATLNGYKAAGYIADFEDDTRPVYPFDQAAWDANYKAKVTDVQESIAKLEIVLQKCRDNIKAAQELAELLGVADSLNSEDFVKYLQDTVFPWALTDKDYAPVAIAAAAEYGITLTEIK